MEHTKSDIFSTKLPVELYHLVLDQIKSPDDTYCTSLAILNLARTSRLNFQIISLWAAAAAAQDIRVVRDIECESIIHAYPQRTSIAILCKRLARICAICNNRATRREIFTELQLCQACEAVYFPKISMERIMDTF